MRPGYYLAIEREVNVILLDALFRPLMRALNISGVYQNARNPLAEALERGRIEYRDGSFTGHFSISLSRALYALGARYSGRTRSWEYDGILPSDLQTAIAEAERRYTTLADSLVRVLDGVDLSKSLDASALDRHYAETVGRMDDAFLHSVRSVAIPPPALSLRSRLEIARSWSGNLKLYVRDFTSRQIINLRQQVQANAMAGQRAQNLVKLVQDQYAVSKHKARFLARQETSLLMSKMRETRYKELGIEKYRWSTSQDERVRKRHVKLHGKVYRWDDPPVVDDKGNHAHPGEDFNCRCVAIPILPGDA